tara:strand:- start:2966 stop:3634 length:669 start_codon:yes stop_codon:yes gene_type:complete
MQDFNQFADDWLDPDGSQKALHRIHPLRMEFILKHIPKAPASIWDAGCAAGLIANDLAAINYDVYACDAAKELVKAARGRAKELGLNTQFKTQPIEKHRPSTPYQAIICSEVIEHVEEPNEILEHFDQCTEKDSVLVISTINRTFEAFIKAIVGAEYILNIIPKGTHRYEKLVTPSEIISPLQKMGWQLLDLTGIDYNPWTEKASLCRSVNINYILAMKKIK